MNRAEKISSLVILSAIVGGLLSAAARHDRTRADQATTAKAQALALETSAKATALAVETTAKALNLAIAAGAEKAKVAALQVEAAQQKDQIVALQRAGAVGSSQ